MKLSSSLLTVLALVLLTLLTACASPVIKSPGPATTALHDAQQQSKAKTPAPADKPAPGTSKPETPPAVIAALKPGAQKTEAKFDLDLNEVDAHAFFSALVDGTDYNIVVHPGVTGKISLHLRNVTVPEVMTVVRDVYGYEFVRQGQMYTVHSSGLQTAVIAVNYLNLQRHGRSETRVNSGQVTQSSGGQSGSQSGGQSGGSSSTGSSTSSATLAGTRIETSGDSDLWGELAQTLQTIISGSPGGQIIVNPQAGLVVVRAQPQDLRLVRQYLNSAQLSLHRQVILEAKIIEVTLKDGFQAGIDWSDLNTRGSGHTYGSGMNGQVLESPAFPANINGVFTGLFRSGDFSATIDLLKSQGDVQVLSSPRVSTINNQKAVIKVGQDEFFVTNVTSTNTVGGGATTSAPQVTLSPFFSGIALDVTPQISESGDIVLHMHPSVTEVRDQTKSLKVFGSEVTLPLALSSVRESDAIVRARSGQVVVIGGLMQDKRSDDKAGVPWLSEIPLIGGIFRQTRENIAKSELVILLRAVIVDEQSTREFIDDSQQRIDAMSARPAAN